MTPTNEPDYKLEQDVSILALQRGKVNGLIETLRALPIDTLITENSWQRRLWNYQGIQLRNYKRCHEAILVFESLIDCLQNQEKKKVERFHKGEPLYQIALCHRALGHRTIFQRYMMLALCEDAVEHKGRFVPWNVGTYRWLVRRLGMSDERFSQYMSSAWNVRQEDGLEYARFPEWVLRRLGKVWEPLQPTLSETHEFCINPNYVRFLLEKMKAEKLDKMGKDRGRPLEYLAHYLIGAIPGCRADLRRKTRSGEFDVIGAVVGRCSDFRAEIGRYFTCECKNWKVPLNASTAKKLCGEMEATGTKFAVLFSNLGITGEKRATDADNVIRAAAQRGKVIVVVTAADLEEIGKRVNFITMLRDKYEKVRFDLYR